MQNHKNTTSVRLRGTSYIGIHTNATYESVYMYLKVFLQHSLTHYLPTANLYKQIKYTSTSPKSNSTPNPSNPVPTYLPGT